MHRIGCIPSDFRENIHGSFYNISLKCIYRAAFLAAKWYCRHKLHKNAYAVFYGCRNIMFAYFFYLAKKNKH